MEASQFRTNTRLTLRYWCGETVQHWWSDQNIACGHSHFIISPLSQLNLLHNAFFRAVYMYVLKSVFFFSFFFFYRNTLQEKFYLQHVSQFK